MAVAEVPFRKLVAAVVVVELCRKAEGHLSQEVEEATGSRKQEEEEEEEEQNFRKLVWCFLLEANHKQIMHLHRREEEEEEHHTPLSY